MHQRIFSILVWAVLGVSIFLTGAFTVYATTVMEKASNASLGMIARFGSPVGEIGIVIALIISSCVALLVRIRYAHTLTVMQALIRRAKWRESGQN